MTKKCKNCSKLKDLKEFYLTNKSVCKECVIKRTVIWMKNNPRRFKKHCATLVAKRKASPSYIKKQAEFYREWYAKCGRKRAKNYTEAANLWRKLNPESSKAYQLVAIAVKLGKIIKPKHCSKCRQERKLIAHHDNYEFPLRVRWLCYSCHKKEHNELK